MPSERKERLDFGKAELGLVQLEKHCMIISAIKTVMSSLYFCLSNFRTFAKPSSKVSNLRRDSCSVRPLIEPSPAPV